MALLGVKKLRERIRVMKEFKTSILYVIYYIDYRDILFALLLSSYEYNFTVNYFFILL